METKTEHAPVPFGKGYQIRPYRSGDEQLILPLFSRVFPRPRPENEWRWIYRHSPHNAKIMLGLANNGDLAAHYGGVCHQAILNGNQARIGNVRDIFSAPAYRSARQGRRALIAGTADLFFDYWTGPGKMVFCFGFPNPRHFRIGRLLMKYRPFSNYASYSCNLERPAGNSFANSRIAACGTVKRINQFESQFDNLWQKRKRLLPFAVARNSQFLNWRFCQNPAQNYQIWAYSPFLSQEINGYVVILPQKEQAWLVDSCLPDSHQASRWFWQQISTALHWQGVSRIATWCSFRSPDLPMLERLGFIHSEKIKDMMPCFRSFDPDLDPEWCDQNFHFTMADSDLV